jgi:hypothetical protein
MAAALSEQPWLLKNHLLPIVDRLILGLFNIATPEIIQC